MKSQARRLTTTLPERSDEVGAGRGTDCFLLSRKADAEFVFEYRSCQVAIRENPSIMCSMRPDLLGFWNNGNAVRWREPCVNHGQLNDAARSPHKRTWIASAQRGARAGASATTGRVCRYPGKRQAELAPHEGCFTCASWRVNFCSYYNAGRLWLRGAAAIGAAGAVSPCAECFATGLSLLGVKAARKCDVTRPSPPRWVSTK
jgi:hypothetical protein